jgi:mxaJ protein
VPYYRSSYVFVSRKDHQLDLHSLDDPSLRKLKIGLQMPGGYGSSPPGLALAHRGIVDNITGYSLFSDYREPNPPARIIEAVAKGEIDVAIVWGPIGGYFAPRQNVPLVVSPVTEQLEPPSIPLAFDICVGVKRGNKELLAQINEVLKRKQSEIDRILDDYGVPRVARDLTPGAQ